MTPVRGYGDRSVCASDEQRQLAGAAIAQFMAIRDGLKGRMEDGGLDDTAATLTAAVLIAQGHALNIQDRQS